MRDDCEKRSFNKTIPKRVKFGAFVTFVYFVNYIFVICNFYLLLALSISPLSITTSLDGGKCALGRQRTC